MKELRKHKKAVPKNFSIEKLPQAKARPGAWKKQLSPNPEPDRVHKNTEVAPVIQEQMIVDVANGKQPKEIEKKYSVSLGYIRSVMIRKFGSLAGMKLALTQMCYENAAAFMAFAAEHIQELTPAQAVLAGKLSIDAGATLEKTTESKPQEIDFAGLTSLGLVLSRVEKVITGTDRTLPAN